MTDVLAETPADPDLSPPPTLEVRGGHKNFGAVHALRGVDLVALPGEVTAHAGVKGAGKPTLNKCVAGTFPFDAGEVRFQGRPAHIADPAAADDLGIEGVHHGLALCD
ncbi:ATP-binding cassette domain-containing protein, partial [Cellulomonas sp. GbtcB1]|uniref:ATP-binding cassette domain-containing protein n=1 Tax=Cellulomonas sp. GbtcB1 TaxID=2824746 RepID=UPI0034D6DE5F